jgi:hypothetical protein
MSKPVAVKNSRSAGTGHQRALSASEIARNARNFETWSAYQNCEEASFSDIPDEFMSDVQEIFDTHNRISKAWLDKVLRPSLSVDQILTQCTEGCR